MRPALRSALAEVRRLMAFGVRPQLVAIAEHHHVCARSLGHALRERGITLKRGAFTRGEVAAHVYYAPHIALAGAPVPEGIPPLLELEDACATWGINGAAEEYEVSEAQICAWLRAHGEASECASRGKEA